MMLVSHLCNYLFKTLLDKYVAKNKVVTPYHPQINGQVEVSNQEKNIYWVKIVIVNQTDWARRIDDALWDYHTTDKTPKVLSLYLLVYGKAHHLPIKLVHKELWALNRLNLDGLCN